MLSDDDDDFGVFFTFYSQAIDKYSEAIGEIPGTSSPEQAELTSTRRLAYTFRTYKKMILWDVLLGIAKK